MSITIDLSEELLERYRQAAAERRVSLERVVAEVATNSVPRHTADPGSAVEQLGPFDEADHARRKAAFEAWVHDMQDWVRDNLPEGHHVDLDRDSFYR